MANGPVPLAKRLTDRAVAERGLELALERLRVAVDQLDEARVGISATEIAVWICALDDDNSAGDPAKRGDGPLPGVRFARDRGVHQLLIATQERITTGGLTFPVTFPATFPTTTKMQWAQRVQLPASARPSRRKEASYDQWLAGHEVRPTLEDAAARVLLQRPSP